MVNPIPAKQDPLKIDELIRQAKVVKKKLKPQLKAHEEKKPK